MLSCNAKKFVNLNPFNFLSHPDLCLSFESLSGWGGGLRILCSEMSWIADLVASLNYVKDETVSTTRREKLGLVSSKIVFEKNCVLVGDTGAGKSNCVNHLFGKNIFESFASAASVTTQCQRFTMQIEYEDAIYNIHLHDTIGFGDTTNAAKAEIHLFRYLDDNVKTVNFCILVTQFGKFSGEWVLNFSNNLKRFNKWVSAHVLILVTHCDKASQKASFWTAFSQNETLMQRLEDFKLTERNFMFVDLNPLKTQFRSTQETDDIVLRIINAQEKHTTGIFTGMVDSIDKQRLASKKERKKKAEEQKKVSKEVLCKNFKEGTCQFGAKCHFSHGLE